ncbi:MAG: cache domain-containing protein [Oscillospiraceae bacterium]|nr:cache domain-containing protein [Oscillospiraceae bacterium]
MARGWYKLAMTDTGAAHVTAPYVDAQTGKWCVTVDRAVMRGSECLGVVSADIFLTDLERIVADAKSESSGYSMLLDGGGDILMHPDDAYAPDMQTEEFLNFTSIANGLYADVWKHIKGTPEPVKAANETGGSDYYTARHTRHGLVYGVGAALRRGERNGVYHPAHHRRRLAGHHAHSVAPHLHGHFPHGRQTADLYVAGFRANRGGGSPEL